MGNTDIQCYAILIRQSNPENVLFSDGVANAIKANNGAVVLTGYNLVQYVACVVFKSLMERERCASMFDQMNIDFDTKDDAIIPKEFAKWW